jgi:hypothetical protein
MVFGWRFVMATGFWGITRFLIFTLTRSLRQADAILKFKLQTLGMSTAYLASARRMFLEGCTHATPMAAVIAGERSLREWCECLSLAKFLYADEIAAIEAEADQTSSAIGL